MGVGPFSPERIGNGIERIASEWLDSYTDLRVTRFSPSIVNGRRYMGVTDERTGQQYAIEINVKEVTDDQAPEGGKA